ncbi:class I SAM-dependent methyltransferase [Pseudoduganella sp. GCM10020061]|uniref:class I SAM-dependent methyltransferase n=1 Tax=Pseudoduganella sp. GCM10020061 TaxID=3317345 RepID=UPI00362D8BCA
MDPGLRRDDGVNAHIPMSWLALPAVRAALIQAGVFIPTLFIVYGAARAGLAPGFATAALVQGALAAAISWRARLPVWWLPIQFVFPVLLLAARSFAVPAWIYLAVFLVMLISYWSTFRTRVPYYPSGSAVWRAFADAVPAGRPLKVIDIGSGLGGFTLDLARRYPDWSVTGIELAPLPWLVSRLRAAGTRARFVRGDYAALKFSDYDAVFAYLSPAAMPALWEKASSEMRPGAILASYEFDIPGHPPTRTVNVKPGGPRLYMWDF